MNAQQTLRPTVVSVYNYVQPMVAVVVSVLTGLGIFKPAHALAVVLVFLGVRFVTKSKSRRDLGMRNEELEIAMLSRDRERRNQSEASNR